MSATFTLDGVAAERFDDVCALLLSAGLPTGDLAAARAPDFIVARDGARIVGAVALSVTALPRCCARWRSMRRIAVTASAANWSPPPSGARANSASRN
jgi:hypothetical protein